jgi:hypothetical protein
MSRIASIVLLVEDRNQENLLRHYLKRLGHDTRRMRVEKTPQGAGEQFVREAFPGEVRAVRAQLARTSACLIVMIDADTLPVAYRLHQLEQGLQDAHEAPRAAADPILVLIPKRSVETWILCLQANEVREDIDYRHDDRVTADSVKAAGQVLFDWTRNNADIPKVCAPSLRGCLPEFTRIPQ